MAIKVVLIVKDNICSAVDQRSSLALDPETVQGNTVDIENDAVAKRRLSAVDL